MRESLAEPTVSLLCPFLRNGIHCDRPAGHSGDHSNYMGIWSARSKEPEMSTTICRAVKVQVHTPVEGQSFKSVSWRWRVETSPLGAYLTGEDGKPLEFDTREDAEEAAFEVDPETRRLRKLEPWQGEKRDCKRCFPGEAFEAARLEEIRELNAGKAWGHKDSAVAHVSELLAEVDRLRAEALLIAFADCEALVSAGLLTLAEKEEAKADALHSAKMEHARTRGYDSKEYLEADLEQDMREHRAACLREMSLAVSLGQFRTAECNERAIVAAHRDAAGFNSSKAGGEARRRALSPAKRKKIATKAARARWAAKKKGMR